MARFLVALLVFGGFAWILVSVVVPRLRRQMAPGTPPAGAPATIPADGSTGVTGEVTDATRESLRKHLEERRKAREAGTKP